MPLECSRSSKGQKRIARLDFETHADKAHRSKDSKAAVKAGRTKTLSAEYTTKIASYFHVSVDYLLGKSQQRNTPAVSAQELSFDDFTYAMYDEGKKLSEENKAKLLEMAKFFVQQQEKENKRK